jgi:NAD(P)-dependent dehydrogenase (short-subunit alcohol dehydrogenase family)
MGRLDRKIALVTGGARRIGRAIVEKCPAEGAADGGLGVMYAT